MRIDLNQLIFAFSDAIDLVGVDEIHHGKRVGYMAWECAKTLAYPEERQTRLFHLGLLHDCGVSSTQVHRQLVNELEWENSDHHCKIGSERLAGFAPLAGLADGVRHHHTRWVDLAASDPSNPVLLDSNLIFLLDRVDALTSGYKGKRRIAVKDKIRRKIDQLRDNFFNAELVDAFMQTSEKESFWITQEPAYLDHFLDLRQGEMAEIFLTAEEFFDMASLFAQVVDAKSTYTAEHSRGVAHLAKYLAGKVTLPETVCNEIEVAGLLHDLGKLQVPDAILEKKDKLDSEDLSFIRHHSYASYAILRKIQGMEKIALWAANHHETLDGSGYPFHKRGEELGIESRIIVVADIFQALAQNRPYRAAQSPEAIIGHLLDGTGKGKLDKDIVALTAENISECYRAATHDAPHFQE